ncbi:Succinyl-CoA:(R)-benzylsuccinate CoA-transferase subunit BbsF [Mycolicibacterium vanbaalenii]|uniref:Succinyl-CoA:(R)-benzylsuccinate CoA-transferase subunit BbsF n=1 Tax=Mycolicibacterium vanbaalenii TaxID=110539 RepID=A0A5S9R012_MYCVN|nr:Succinyl-CoA:(R)-benzylsuccinate CoA-transferase subunit BbsF [Mycolicibacterium vanbaalenii]
MGFPAAVLAHAQSAAQCLGVGVDAGELLGGRAALLGLQSRGQVSAGGATRLMGDGTGAWCALTLSRPDDVAAVPALVESDDLAADPWPVLARRVGRVGAVSFAERARLLGLPVGVLGETTDPPGAAPRIRRLGGRRPTPVSPQDLLVVDLSSMWAGPLCARLLARAGATVVKVETAARPDGTRAGAPAFFDWVNSGKLSYRADFRHPEGLRRLLAAADAVIESSRPAALERHGLGPSDQPDRDGRIWLRITGHGTEGEHADWVAFGDDAAVSGGLVAGAADAPRFCGDAIADPLTGIHAALAILQSCGRGGGELIELSMAGVSATYARLPVGDEITCAATPVVPQAAAALGADNAAVERLAAQRLTPTC